LLPVVKELVDPQRSDFNPEESKQDEHLLQCNVKRIKRHHEAQLPAQSCGKEIKVADIHADLWLHRPLAMAFTYPDSGGEGGLSPEHPADSRERLANNINNLDARHGPRLSLWNNQEKGN
jgi:hypothetical protein